MNNSYDLKSQIKDIERKLSKIKMDHDLGRLSFKESRETSHDLMEEIRSLIIRHGDEHDYERFRIRREFGKWPD